MSGEIIPFDRTPDHLRTYEGWCEVNGFDPCVTNEHRYAAYRVWAVSNGYDPYWEIPF